MVTAGMRRYKVRTDDQKSFIGSEDQSPLELDSLFGTQRPLRLELGFGHGEFITAMAAEHPQESFIGVEHDPLRVTKTAHKCAKAGLDNVRLFGGDAHAFVRFRLPPASVNKIYILFSDPWPKTDHRRRRLVNRSFLLDLARIAAPGCIFVFGSDTHNYTLQVLSNTTTLPGLWRNCYAPVGYRVNIPTRFPTLFETYKKEEGCTIAYLMLERTTEPAPPSVPWPVAPPRRAKRPRPA